MLFIDKNHESCFSNVLHEFSQFEQLNKKINFLLIQNRFFLSLFVKKEIVIFILNLIYFHELDKFKDAAPSKNLRGPVVRGWT